MEKETTIYDIAQRLNVSVATVSRALKDDPVVSKKTKKKVLDLAEALGYRTNNFARNLRSQKTNTVGVIVPRLDSYFMSTVLAGMEEVLNAEGFTLLISQSFESARKEKENARTMYNNRVDGLLVSLAYDTQDTSHFDPFFKKGIPVLFFDRGWEHDCCTNIVIDNKKAAHDATAHLIGQGCRRIAHLTVDSNRNVYHDRLQGYRQALQEAGLSYDEQLLLYSDLSQKAGAEVAQRLLQMEALPDGIFSVNDNVAIGCLMALKAAGIRIPEEVAIVGFNDDPVARVVEPNLTTIHYPGQKMGELAALNLVHHLNGSVSIDLTNTIILRSELVVRASSLKSRNPQ